MSLEFSKETKDREQNHQPRQEDDFFGMTSEEKELLEKAKEKYKTADDLLQKGIGWVKGGPVQADSELKYHKLSPHESLPKKEGK